ncbi:hypothetical protein [Streptomyces sp. NPDC059071]|uniref:hypothetical protein n=1 Tax=unclassified Streptomyces TaxID=2593676 RepID=UPI0036539C0D
MSVMSPARPAEHLADYNTLAATHQRHFDSFMELADNTTSATEYDFAMAAAALSAGITLPPDGEIAKCACPLCHCGAIFDTAAPGLREVEPSDGYGLPRLQCSTCTDEHPAPREH